MTRNLKSLGLSLLAALALGAVAASAAQAEFSSAAKFTANVAANETAKGDGEQIGTAEFAIAGLPATTCTTARGSGRALTVGSSSTEVVNESTYENCHIVIGGVTKLITITANGCSTKYNATTTETAGGVKEFTADATLQCPAEKKVEVHVYNEASGEATTLCTFTIAAQGPLKGISLTNEPGEGGQPDYVIAHVNVSGIAIQRVLGSALVCGPQNNTAVASGTVRIRATNAAGSFVNGTVSE